MNASELESKTMVELYAMARELGLQGYSKLRKQELIFELLTKLTENDGHLMARGTLEILPDVMVLRPLLTCPVKIISTSPQIAALTAHGRLGFRPGQTTQEGKVFALLRVKVNDLILNYPLKSFILTV